VVLTGLTDVGQWTRGLVFRCVLGSEGSVLVPRSSGTPVATWAWPTWVVSPRRVLEAVFILLEFPSPSRRIFIGSHSLPLSVRRIGPSVMHVMCGPENFHPAGSWSGWMTRSDWIIDRPPMM
jgi:hypothetical protein